MLTNLFVRQNILPLTVGGIATVVLGIAGLAQVARVSSDSSSPVPHMAQAASMEQTESTGGYRYGDRTEAGQMPQPGSWQGNTPQNPYAVPTTGTTRNAPGYGYGYGNDSGNVPSSGFTPGYTSGTGTTAPDNSSDDITKGYWERQRSQDQQAQAFDGYINDTTTVRDTQTGEIHSDVSNDIANPAIESGAATEVPTADLPTSYDSSASASSSSASSASSDSSSSE